MSSYFCNIFSPLLYIFLISGYLCPSASFQINVVKFRNLWVPTLCFFNTENKSLTINDEKVGTACPELKKVGIAKG